MSSALTYTKHLLDVISIHVLLVAPATNSKRQSMLKPRPIFINSAIVGNINEMREIIMKGNSYSKEQDDGWVAKNSYSTKYGQHVTQVLPLQIFRLTAFLLATGILVVWSVTLHKSLTKKDRWFPRRGSLNDAIGSNGIQRQLIGIMIGRSQSNASYELSKLNRTAIVMYTIVLL